MLENTNNPCAETGVVVDLESIETQETHMPRREISQVTLQSLLNYDSMTGVFTWRERPWKRSRRRAGDVAGTVKIINGNPRTYIGIDGHDYIASRLAWIYVYGEAPKNVIAHKNGDSSDLRIDNLAPAPTVDGHFDHRSKEGRNAYGRAHRAAHPEHYRAKELKRDFDLSVQEYAALLLAQDGVCAVCRKPETATRYGKLKHLAVDHNHGTGEVRGLLCAECNTGLGKFGDDPALLRGAADYLDTHNAKHEVVPLKKEAS